MTELSAYATGISRKNIEDALRDAGKDPTAIEPSELAALEDFHTLGRLATSQLAQLARVAHGDRVLDAGTGIGGTARFLAAGYGCAVTGIDLTDEFCDTARWLTDAAGLADRVTIACGDVTDLRFADGVFDVVFSQHVQMNVADKSALYAEAHRVLAPGGRLAMWDVTGTADRLRYPVPWALDPTDSHVVTSEQLRATVEGAGFGIEQRNDLTEQATQLMAAIVARPPNPLGLQVFVPDFPTKLANMSRGLADGSLRLIQAVAVRR